MQKTKVLILGASGFIGYSLYKELCPFFNTYGTYHTGRHTFSDNKKFYNYSLLEQPLYPILEEISPSIIISAIRGNFAAQIRAHEEIAHYVQIHRCKVLFLSSANVFDAYTNFASYEHDKTLSLSIYGRLKIKIENTLLKLSSDKVGILRLPMVFGSNSPRIKEVKSALIGKTPIEVFPNLIMNVTNEDKICQQIHYLINRDKTGIFHLGSKDLVHHEEFIIETIKKMGNYHPLFKQVYTSNEHRYLAALPKNNLLPESLSPTYQDIINQQLSS